MRVFFWQHPSSESQRGRSYERSKGHFSTFSRWCPHSFKFYTQSTSSIGKWVTPKDAGEVPLPEYPRGVHSLGSKKKFSIKTMAKSAFLTVFAQKSGCPCNFWPKKIRDLLLTFRARFIDTIRVALRRLEVRYTPIFCTLVYNIYHG